MEFWIVLAVCATVFISYPFLRCLFKRIQLWIKLKTVCRKRGFKIFGTSLFWLFGTNSSEMCDFYIETSEKVFAVKLFSVLHRRSVLVFCHDGKYFIRSYSLSFLPILSTRRHSSEENKKDLPDYRFRYKYRLEWEIKSPKRVLLINPVCGEIRIREETGREFLRGFRESVNGIELFNLTYFITMLEGLKDVSTEAF